MNNMEKTLSEYISIAKNIDKLKLEKKLKISILSSFTLNGLEETLHVMCSELGIKSQSYVSGYNQYNQELLNPESNFYNFSPDITFLILDIRNFLGDIFHFPYNLSDQDRKNTVNEKTEQLKKLINIFEENSKSKLIISIFPLILQMELLKQNLNLDFMK